MQNVDITKEHQQVVKALEEVNVALKKEIKKADIKNELDEKVIYETVKETKELKQTQLWLNKTLEEVEKIESKKDSLFDRINQDVRTPMVVIKGYTDLLIAQKYGDLTSIQKEKLLLIQNSINDLNESFEKILTILKNLRNSDIK